MSWSDKLTYGYSGQPSADFRLADPEPIKPAESTGSALLSDGLGYVLMSEKRRNDLKKLAAWNGKRHPDDRLERCQEDYIASDCEHCGAKHIDGVTKCLGTSAMQCLGLDEPK